MQSKSTAYISFFANLFHFPKLSSVHNFHSLLWQLLTSEFAVLLFDCERHKLAAQSYPTTFFLFKDYESLLQLFFRKARTPFSLQLSFLKESAYSSYSLFFQKFKHSCKTGKADRAAVVSDHFAKYFDLTDKDCEFTCAGKCGI